MLGTAFPAARLFLVEEPFPWGANGLATSRFDAATARALQTRGREEGVRIQAIRRLGRRGDDGERRWAAVDTRAAHVSLRWGRYGDDRELLELPFDGSLGEPDPEPVYLVCTHGRHDPCCAQRGRPVAAALAALSPDRVWQASHLGGCRFSPTVLVLPSGLMYGRVPCERAADLTAAVAADEVLNVLLRGRIGMAPAAQAAVGHLHSHLGLTGRTDVTVLASTRIDAELVRVETRTPQGPFAVTIRRRRVDAAGLTCAAPGPSWFVAHELVAIEPVT